MSALGHRTTVLLKNNFIKFYETSGFIKKLITAGQFCKQPPIYLLAAPEVVYKQIVSLN